MKRGVSFFLGIIMTLCLTVSGAGAANVSTVLRVGLTVGGVNSFSEARLENVSGYQEGYTVGTMDGTAFVGSTKLSSSQLTMKLVDDAFQISDTGTGKVLYTAPKGADHLAIHPNSTLTWFKGYKWHGDFVYRRSSAGGITVINYVSLEDYVKGVLPYEVDPDWPAESLKAQAVCARSFALGTHKHTGAGYDLCNTTNCQVYLGANRATAASDAAVEDTKGEYLTYQGDPVVGYFFSSDGGATEDASNVWGGDYAYLKGKTDPYEGNVDEWTVTLSADEIRAKLNNAGYQIGEVADVSVTKRTAMGNVNEVTVKDTAGKEVVINRSAVRTVFGLKSIRYQITPNIQTSASVMQPVKNALTIKASTHQVSVDGKTVSPQGYNINGYNYYKLRDIAYILNGTAKQFNVTWDGTNNRILLNANTAYRSVGGEMASSQSTVIKNSALSDVNILLDGKPVSLSGYRINGNNYYKVRDIADVIGFGIDYQHENSTVLINSSNAADPEDGNPSAPVIKPTSYTFKGTGWGHSVGMSQWGAYAMAKQGFTYEEILKFYFTGIEIGR